MTLRQNLHVNQGETFSFTHIHKVAGSPVDLSGYSARMSVRDWFGEGLKAYFSTASDADGGTLTLPSSPTGAIVISMTATQSSGIIESVPAYSFADDMGDDVDAVEKYIYDLEIVSGAGAVTRVIQGEMHIRRGVTE